MVSFGYNFGLISGLFYAAHTQCRNNSVGSAKSGDPFNFAAPSHSLKYLVLLTPKHVNFYYYFFFSILVTGTKFKAFPVFSNLLTPAAFAPLTLCEMTQALTSETLDIFLMLSKRFADML